MEKVDSVKGGLWKEEQEALRRQAHQVHLLVGTGRRAERISRRKFIPRAWMSVSLQEGRESPGLSSFLLTHFFWATSSQFIPVFPGTGHCRWVQIEVRWRTGTCFFQVHAFSKVTFPHCVPSLVVVGRLKSQELNIHATQTHVAGTVYAELDSQLLYAAS